MVGRELRWPRGVSDLCYGGDYNPEQWPEQVWAEDIALMRQARVNLVNVGVFAWSRLEPREGQFDFDWLDRVLDLLHAGGIRVGLATPTASPPPWFSLAHPDALPVRADGVRLRHGSRDTYCASAPAYQQACHRITTALAQRYAGHPALALWHVHNEYGTWCYCDHTAAAFRDWLRLRYPDLDTLNDAWTTSFWGQHYSDWTQILPPVATQYLPNPGQQLDFRRFLSDELRAHFLRQRDLLREVSPELPVTTNFVLGDWAPVEPWSWSDEVDFVAIDHYPSASDTTAEEQSAFAADLARSWSGERGWLLMEQAASAILTPGRVLPKAPGRYARMSLIHVARGSHGAMSFQWRASRGGAELWHPALVPHAGPDSRVFREVVAFGETLHQLSEVDGKVEAQVAILWDAQAGWALDATTAKPSDQVDYRSTVAQVHAALWRVGVTVDFARPGADLSAYRLVLLPCLYLMTDPAVQAVRDYVAGGGNCAVWYFSGITDAYGRIRTGGYPGALRDILGVRVEELHPLPAGVSVPLSSGDTAQDWTEQVNLMGASVLSRYSGGALNGCPAITRNQYGSGTAWYLSAGLDRAGLSRWLDEIRLDAGVGPVLPELPAGVEVVCRRAEASNQVWWFVLNHTEAVQEVPVAGVELVSGREVFGALSVPAGGYAVVRAES